MSGFYLNDESASNSSTSSLSDALSTLPYPAPLPRSDFLTADFDPIAYLSSLGHRHQTLEDLRSDLRARSQLLNTELLDLVNAHFADFLNLGTDLKGGREKVEELKLGLLGFQREVEEIRRVVSEKENMIGRLLEQRKAVRKEMAEGRRLLEWEERMTNLEAKLMVVGYEQNAEQSEGSCSSDEEDDEEDDNDAENEEKEDGSATKRIKRRVRDYLVLRHMEEQIGSEHPFVVAQRARSIGIRNTILLDLGTSLKQARRDKSNTRSLKVMALYRDIDAAKEAIQVLRSVKV